jgi:predicted transcriptional regulator
MVGEVERGLRECLDWESGLRVLGFELACMLDAGVASAYRLNMDTISITPERKAELEEYAHRRGQDTASALDTALAEYLAWERRDFQEAVQGIQEGYDGIKAGRTQPAEKMFEELRMKYVLPR